MIGLLTLVPKPYLILGAVLALAATHGVAYYKGYQRAEHAQAALIVEQWKKEQELKVAYNHASKELVKAYQAAQTKEKIVYRTIKEKVYEKATGAVCLNNSTAGLWDDALFGNMPDTSTRAVEETSRTYTDAEVVTNAVENFEQYKECRSQLNALIDWHEKVEAVNGAK